MKRNIATRFGLGTACSLSLILAACGDPCLDDGLGKGECVPAGNADEVGSEETDETSEETAEGTMEDDTETGTADQGTTTETETDTGDPETYCADDDMDGYGDPEDCEEVPAGEDPPAGSVPQSNGEDCADDDANTFPGAAPNDDPEACMTDADGDDYGDEMPSNSNAVPGSDCNDTSANTFPGAAPNDDPDACMQDEDDDDYGDSAPVGTTIPGTDCNDADANVFNCTLWCEDADQDGAGGQNCVEVVPGEEPPEGYVEGDNDCLDDNPDVYPGAAEQEPELCTADIDDDGYGDMNAEMTYPGSQNGTDCDDSSATTFPGAAEIDDPNACMSDADDDGWGESNPGMGVAPGNDCDDGDAARVVCPDAIPGCVDTTVGGSADLMATAFGGDGNYTFAWTPADTLSDPNIPNPVAMPTDITTYTVTATDGLGNMGTDDLTVHLTDKSWILGGVPEAECEAVGFLGAPAAHSFSADGTTTCTTSNSDPTAYICPIVHESVRITGTMSVNTTSDDDWMGFVWGWQSEDQFYMLSWKQANQGCGNAGIVVKLVDRQDAYTGNDFACDADTPNVTVLMDQSETTTAGWIDNRVYDVEVLYDTTQTEITITDTSNSQVVANFTVVDDTYPSGQFGTYDYSQQAACNGPWQSSCL